MKIQAKEHSNECPNPGWEEGSQSGVRLYQRDPAALLGLTQGRQSHRWSSRAAHRGICCSRQLIYLKIYSHQYLDLERSSEIVSTDEKTDTLRGEGTCPKSHCCRGQKSKKAPDLHAPHHVYLGKGFSQNGGPQLIFFLIIFNLLILQNGYTTCIGPERKKDRN